MIQKWFEKASEQQGGRKGPFHFLFKLIPEPKEVNIEDKTEDGES